MNTIYFDMDGTIADLYGVDNWLDKLLSEDASPYLDAEPLVDMDRLQKLLNGFQKKGCKLGVITWLSKGSTESYDEKVTEAKLSWLQSSLPEVKFDEIHVVPYGQNKHETATDKDGVLFDDDDRVRGTWGGESINPKTTDINDFLGGRIWVRPHTRKGRPVKGHFRRRRA